MKVNLSLESKTVMPFSPCAGVGMTKAELLRLLDDTLPDGVYMPSGTGEHRALDGRCIVSATLYLSDPLTP